MDEESNYQQKNRADPAPSGGPAVEETSRGPGLCLRAHLPQRQPQSYFRFPRPSTPAQVRKDGRWAPGAAPRRGCRARTAPGPAEDATEFGAAAAPSHARAPRGLAPRTPRSSEGSARRFDPREVSGPDTRAPATCAPETAPGAARPPRPALLTLGGARLCRPLSPPLLTPRGGERERELADSGRVRTTILDSPCFPGDSESLSRGVHSCCQGGVSLARRKAPRATSAIESWMQPQKLESQKYGILGLA
ncbi:putative hydro-lyase KRH_21160 [Microtus oregoni]|uniref:putative hydro-lyase KRH_21160 n=1 Tax=Microtus oregoni TaxID=111838 RepID=UPI001BB29604|nr:putative hydro-lyase KRH_21160 [Microtus oregoni]